VLGDEESEWLLAHVEPVSVAVEKERPWATTYRVETTDGNVVWFKACGAVQRFEPRLTAQLSSRWPDRVTEVIAHDEERAFLLMRDAGIPIGVYGNPPEPWLQLLPRYAELQRGEARYAEDHVAHGVPDRRLDVLPEQYAHMAARNLPLEDDELRSLRDFVPTFASLCSELATREIPASVQHDDLHMTNVTLSGDRLRVVDWGDASVAHPFFSLVVTFSFLESVGRLGPADPWFTRLRDAYLEPWGAGLVGTFELAFRLGRFAYAVAWTRQRDHLPPRAVEEFDRWYPATLRAAVPAAREAR
jgi:Phosphotransferase enzyme family